MSYDSANTVLDIYTKEIKSVSQRDIWGSVPGRGDSKYEDFEVGVCLVSLRNNKKSQDG